MQSRRDPALERRSRMLPRWLRAEEQEQQHAAIVVVERACRPPPRCGPRGSHGLAGARTQRDDLGRETRDVLLQDRGAYRGLDFQSVKWVDGKIGMTFATVQSKEMGDINPQLIGFAPIPTGPTGLASSEVNCGMNAERKISVLGLLPETNNASRKIPRWSRGRAESVSTAAALGVRLLNCFTPRYIR